MQMHQIRPLHRGDRLVSGSSSTSHNVRPYSFGEYTVPSPVSQAPHNDNASWVCPSCDFVNSADTPICIVDLVVRPGDELNKNTHSPLLSTNQATTSTPKDTRNFAAIGYVAKRLGRMKKAGSESQASLELRRMIQNFSDMDVEHFCTEAGSSSEVVRKSPKILVSEDDATASMQESIAEDDVGPDNSTMSNVSASTSASSFINLSDRADMSPLLSFSPRDPSYSRNAHHLSDRRKKRKTGTSPTMSPSPAIIITDDADRSLPPCAADKGDSKCTSRFYRVPLADITNMPAEWHRTRQRAVRARTRTRLSATELSRAAARTTMI
eukprot:m.587614 g.587614  ORF g.587614 m.587614 type:complete len:324 (-) comp22354_c0_seq5:2752-3723(-)